MDPSLNPYQSPAEPLDALVAEAAPVRAPPGAIPFQGSVTVDEALEADSILLPWQTVQVYGACVVFGGLAVVCVIVMVLNLLRGDEGMIAWLVGLIIFGSLFVSIAFGRINIRRKANTLYRQRYGIYCETAGFVSSDEIHSRTDAGWSTILWHAFKGYKASPHVLMLYWSNSPGFMILTRGKFANDADWERVRSLVVARVPPIA